MKTAILAALSIMLASTPAIAQRNTSQHPRVGRLAELVFERESSKLPLQVGNTMGEVAAWAHENPDGLIVIDGHASDKRSPTLNVRLSLDRARRVRSELVTLGVDPNQIVMAAYGERGPRKGPNRRVVIWATRAGMDAVVARIQSRGRAMIYAGLVSEMDRRPQPGVVANR